MIKIIINNIKIVVMKIKKLRLVYKKNLSLLRKIKKL